ncbi:MAG: DUF421 domain-containing protein [Ponticaulis sp.]|nr:DUF421 domain-containing protein [Ponticaulis sp.]
MNNFDWIVTVALGSLVGSGIILKDITVLESLTSIGVLLLLQWALTKTIYHNKHVANLVKAEPVVLASEGVMNRNAMRRERVTESELMAAVRDNGLVSLDQVRWIILETDATMNVIPTADIDIDAPEYLQKLEGFGHQPQAHPPG